MSQLQNYLNKTPLKEQNSETIAYLASLDVLSRTNPLVARHILQELFDQRSNLKLIASENFSSLAVQLSMGNLLTDKYSEGYAKHRFYAGCENIDAIEEEAGFLARNIFRCDHAYVQPHSGADANLVAFWSILIKNIQNREIELLSKKNIDELSDEEYEKIRKLMMNQKVMGMGLESGGHLTHGYRHNISSKMMQAINYQVSKETGLLNYDAIAEQARKEKPTILIAGYSAYPRKIDFAKMREIANDVNATLMVDMAHFAGFVAGKVFTGEFDPIPYAHIVTSTTHKTLRGPRGGIVLCSQEYADTVNKGCPLVLGGPLPHMLAAKAVAFKEIDNTEYRKYARQMLANSQALAKTLLENDIEVLTEGTDNHIVLFDVTKYGLTGRQAESALRQAGITANRNTIPSDPNGPWYTSGVRIGSPAVTTLGMKEAEMKEIANLISLILKNSKAQIVERTGKASKAKFSTKEHTLLEVRKRVSDLLHSYPLYPELDIEMETAFSFQKENAYEKIECT